MAGRATTESTLGRALILGSALAFLAIFLLMPLIAVFAEALEDGIGPYLASVAEPDAIAAIRLTLTVAAISVPANILFGIAAPGRSPSSTFRARASSSPSSTCRFRYRRSCPG